jgi:hypothetical protein
VPGVIDRPNCANTANKSPPRIDWSADVGLRHANRACIAAIMCPRAGQIPSSRAIGRPSAAESRWESSGTRRPGDDVSTSTHRARFAAQSGGDFEEYGVNGSGYQNHAIRGSRRHVKGSRHRVSNAPDQRGVVGPTRASCGRSNARQCEQGTGRPANGLPRRCRGRAGRATC